MSIELAVGQKWREVDPRVHRIVEIVQIATTTERRCIQIKTVESANPNAIGKLSWADRQRFNGKRGGYAPKDAA
ncbi:hypothetical protein NDK50_08115 [Paraburkholderia bryophila]|uniref:hypothetical protein n=1 Tax=Paraburkholderia bryophila TaxID=420952 RepID=UPI00234A4204|nr:hypothetical protein [Paraburkholderia bryophila]WCM21401.1 hypothetical protein NDK50_08115 [Paraburkholderia bryophila]